MHSVHKLLRLQGFLSRRGTLSFGDLARQRGLPEVEEVLLSVFYCFFALLGNFCPTLISRVEGWPSVPSVGWTNSLHWFEVMKVQVLAHLTHSLLRAEGHFCLWLTSLLVWIREGQYHTGASQCLFHSKSPLMPSSTQLWLCGSIYQSESYYLFD